MLDVYSWTQCLLKCFREGRPELNGRNVCQKGWRVLNKADGRELGSLERDRRAERVSRASGVSGVSRERW